MVFQVLLNMTSQWKYIHDCDDGDDDDDDDDDDGMSTVQCSPQDLLAKLATLPYSKQLSF